jgi:hypothetical protein
MENSGKQNPKMGFKPPNAFLEEHHFEIEHKALPKKPKDETDESEELIVLVARKCVQT